MLVVGRERQCGSAAEEAVRLAKYLTAARSRALRVRCPALCHRDSPAYECTWLATCSARKGALCARSGVLVCCLCFAYVRSLSVTYAVSITYAASVRLLSIECAMHTHTECPTDVVSRNGTTFVL